MPLPIDFQFSQNNLQDYLDCPRRFQLKHLLKIQWPAVESEPVLEQERLLDLGQRFHRMVQQHQAGLPVDAVTAQATDPDLARLWNNYLLYAPQTAGGQVKVETLLSAPFGGYRLVAKYDLLVFFPDSGITIIDWKTSKHRPSRKTLQQRIQTRLYQFLITQVGWQFDSRETQQPEQVTMIYWFAEDPKNPERFIYTEAEFLADHDFFLNQIRSIESRTEAVFPLTTDEKRCLYCQYRSLCQRGATAGDASTLDFDEDDQTLIKGLDFEQIAEIQF